MAKRIGIIAGFVICLIISGFSKNSLAAKPILIGFATKSATNLFWPVLQEGARDAAKDLNVELIMAGPSTVNNLNEQLDVVRQMLSRRIDALVIAPCDSSGVVPVVLEAQRLKKPVIAVDTAVIGAKVTSLVATNNITATESAAEWIATQLKGSGRVVMVNGILAQQTGRDRRDGFVNFIKLHYPGIEIVREIPAEWDPPKAKAGIEALLRENVDFDAVFCSWDDATTTVSAALKAIRRRKHIILVGFDGAPNALKLLNKGEVDADVAQFAYKMGYQAIKCAIYAAKGKPIPPNVQTSSMVVTKDNLYDFLKKSHMTIGD